MIPVTLHHCPHLRVRYIPGATRPILTTAKRWAASYATLARAAEDFLQEPHCSCSDAYFASDACRDWVPGDHLSLAKSDLSAANASFVREAVGR